MPFVQYYDDAAGILRSIILSAIAPHRLATAPPTLPAFPRDDGEDKGSYLDLPSHDDDGAFHLYADSEDGLRERWAFVIAFSSSSKRLCCHVLQVRIAV